MTDPRYDPRFQRGWNGEPPPAVRPAPRLAPDAPAASEPAPSSFLASPPPAGSVREPVEPVEPAADEPTEEVGAEPARPARNPYRVALVAVGVVLAVGAGGMLWQIAQPMSAYTPSDYVLPQLETMVAPWVAFAGLLAIIAAVALGAFRRR